MAKSVMRSITGSTMVENLTHNNKAEGQTPAPGTEREKMVETSFTKFGSDQVTAIFSHTRTIWC